MRMWPSKEEQRQMHRESKAQSKAINLHLLLQNSWLLQKTFLCKDPNLLLFNMLEPKQRALLHSSARDTVLRPLPCYGRSPLPAVLPSATRKCLTSFTHSVRTKASTSLPALSLANGKASNLSVLRDVMPVVVPTQPWK